MSKIDELIQQYCPDGVEYKKLEDLGIFYGGLTGKAKSDFSNGNAKFISYMNVYSNIAVDLTTSDRVKISEGEKQNTVAFGDVLFTGSSETSDECGMSSVLTVKTEELLYLNSFCFGFRLNDTALFIPDFLKYLFRDLRVRKQIVLTASGVTRFNISKTRFKKITIPIPPLPVQEEIVRILDKFTELEARRKQYEFYRDKLLNFKGIGADITRGGYKLMSLGEIISSLRTGLNPRQNFRLNTDDSVFNYITVRELNVFTVSPTNKTDKINDAALKIINGRSHLQFGDILFSATGTIGRTALIDEHDVKWNVKEGVYVLTVDANIVNQRFLIYYFHSTDAINQFTQAAEGGTVKSISMEKFKKISITIPPIAEQERIVAILDKFDALVNDISIGLPAELEERRKQYEYYRDRLLTFKPMAKEA